MTEILFVCTGNTCRSPIAEGLFNVYVNKHGIAAHAFSRGLAAEGGAASKNAVESAAEYGADLSQHVSRQLTEEDLAAASRVYCMSSSHLDAIRAAFPQYEGKLALLSAHGIADPYGMDISRYRETARQIAGEVVRIAQELAERENGDKNN